MLSSVLGNVERLFDHSVADRFEFLVLRERNALGRLVGVGAVDEILILIPQFIELTEPLIVGKLVHDLVDKRLGIGVQIAVNFLSARFGKNS